MEEVFAPPLLYIEELELLEVSLTELIDIYHSNQSHSDIHLYCDFNHQQLMHEHRRLLNEKGVHSVSFRDGYTLYPPFYD
ncbi:hypothetical protein VAZ01S_017_00680 [Vibrio azureus NBRC 104587]|uniref:Uncharacterized protein n=1 Tax=Vibrio azureus NBRC 104587 TaxID=1219077 RepID=U3ANU6_9VIBR|nr:hypothetical protein VAZ01S_017_00680 [Vibrio azureus NBRC 104587]